MEREVVQSKTFRPMIQLSWVQILLLKRSHKAHFPGQNLYAIGNALEGVLEKSVHKVQTAVESRFSTRDYPGSCQVETLIFPVTEIPSLLWETFSNVLLSSESIIFSCIQLDFSLEQLVSLTSCPVTMNPCEESNPIFSTGTFCFPKVCAELSAPLAHRAELCLSALLNCF